MTLEISRLLLICFLRNQTSPVSLGTVVSVSPLLTCFSVSSIHSRISALTGLLIHLAQILIYATLNS